MSLDLLTLPVPLLLLPVLVPLAGAIGMALCHRRPNLREAVTLLTAGTLFLLVLAIYSSPELPAAVSSPPLFGTFALTLKLEPLGMLFMLVASGLWIINSLYSIGYMRANREHHQTRFYICFALSLAAVMGLAMSGNLLTLFVFYEVITLATWPLVTHSGTAEARRGGRIYLGVLLSTSICLFLLAIVWVATATGSLDFRPGGIVAGKITGPAQAILLLMFMFGIGKAALMPVHRWLPAAMVAPTPVSALLHAVAVVKAGVFTVLKVIVYIFGVETLRDSGATLPVVWIAAFTLLAASVMALRQDHLKRRLAYSTVSQLSYVTLATAMLTPLSLQAAAFHIAAHACSKITLFFAAGAIHTAAHKDYVSQLDGIGRRMPWTMAAFAIGALSMAGLPPAAGFLTKWFLLQGAWEGGWWPVALVLLLSTLLNAAYFMPILYRAFFRPLSPGHDDHPPHGEAPFPMVLALSLTAAASLYLFFVPDVPLELARQMVVAVGGAVSGKVTP